MTGLESVLPQLKPHDWEGRQQTLCRPLLELADDGGVPMLGFGWDHEHTFEFLTREKAKASGWSMEVVEAVARDQLARLDAEWQRQDVELDDLGTLSMMVHAGDWFSTERVLLPDFMQQAHDQLGAELLAVGVPRRGLLIVADGGQDPQLLGRFGMLVSAQYHRAESAPITPLMVAVQGGRVIGVLRGTEESGKKLAETTADEGEADIFLRVLSITHEDSGKKTLNVLVGGQPEERLCDAALRAVVGLLQTAVEDPEFGGEVQIVVVPPITPDTDPLRVGMEALVDQVMGIVRETGMNPVSGDRVVIGWQYGA